MEKCFIVNDYIENDPLSEENLYKTLILVNRIRLSMPSKTIWLYTGYTWEEIIGAHRENQIEDLGNGYSKLTKRAQIIMNCNVLVDGQYIESQRNTSLPWRGSENQRVIDIKQSLKNGEVILWQI